MPIPPRPLSRFLARYLDILLFSIVVGLLLSALDPSFFESSNGKSNDAGLTFLFILLWVPVEAICLAKSGTTPAKAILGIRVVNKDGNKPTFSQALSRSFYVWRNGLACGLPLIYLITAAVAYRKLKNTGSTSWDKRLELSVSQHAISMTRQIIFGVLLLGLTGFVIYGAMQP